MNRACIYYVLRFVFGTRAAGLTTVDGAKSSGRGRRGKRASAARGGRRVRGAILAVSLSLVPLVTVVEVSTGMIEGITARYLAFGTFHLQIRFFGDHSYDEIVGIRDRVAGMDGITEAFLVYEGVGLLNADDERIGVTIRAYQDGIVTQDEDIASFLTIDGGYPAGKDIAVSKGIADRLKIGIGTTGDLIVARTLSNGRMIPKQARGEITSTFSTGYADLDGQTVLISTDSARALFPDTRSLFIGIKVEDPFRELYGRMSGLRNILPTGAYVYQWRELERGMFSTFQTTRMLLIIVMAVIVAVATLTVSSSLFILVAEREQEIALLRSVGANARDIRRSFVLLGFTIGGIGAFAGIGLGLLVSLRINEIFTGIESVLAYARIVVDGLLGNTGHDTGAMHILDPSFYLTRIPIDPRLPEILAIAFSSIGISAVSAWIPARRAGRIRPIEALTRH